MGDVENRYIEPRMITTLHNIVHCPYYEQAYYQPTEPIFDLQKYL